VLRAAITGFAVLLATSGSLNAQDEASATAEQQMMAQYESEMARGNAAAALKYVLEYAEEAYGENAPETVRLSHRYGKALFDDGRYRDATDVLLKSLERSTAAFGESGGEAFEINMNIGYAYGKWHDSLSKRMKYFDRALEILRERGERETITYVTTLVSIVVDMMDSGRLGGTMTSSLSDTMYSEAVTEYILPIEQEYRNNFGRADKYMREAIEIAKDLESEDEYISAKVAIAQAKLKVMETVDLDAVPMGVDGYISGGTASNYYDEEEQRILVSIDVLSQDIDANRLYLEAANKVLMEIAWIDKDNDRMMAMCDNGTLNSAGEYTPDRLYEVLEGGIVVAPDLPLSVNKNLFKRRISRRNTPKDKDGNPVKRPYFIPVCIDGELMAALVNVPRVTVEELR
jgi:tetratricopeptide (TPR) repeat protein